MKIYFYNCWLRLGLLLACLLPEFAMSQDLASLYASEKSLSTQSNVRQPLKQVLRQMEAKYHVFFTYKDVVLEDKMVQIEDTEWIREGASSKQIEKLIADLLATQQLSYKKMENIYVIFPREGHLNIRQIKQPSHAAIEGEASTGNQETSY